MAGRYGRAVAPRLLALDGLRGLAALPIAAYHAWLLSGEAALGGGPWRDALSSGHLAVTLFFVLSGFVLLWPAARSGEYRRPGGVPRPACRPADARVLGRARHRGAGVPAVGSGGHLSARPGLARLGARAPVRRAERGSADRRLRRAPGVRREPGGVDDQRRAAGQRAPARAGSRVPAPAVAGRERGAGAGGRGAARTAAHGLVDRTGALVLSSTPVHFADFACGMAAAALVARGATVGRGPAAAAGAGLLAILVLAGGADGSVVRDAARENPLTMLLVPVLFAVLCAAASRQAPPVLAARPLVWLGTVSYGIFLSHFLVIGFARETLGLGSGGTVGDFLAMEVVALAGAVFYGWLSWRLVERPAQAWGRRFSSGRARRRSSSARPVSSSEAASG